MVTAALQALKDGGVLAVHRNDLRAVLFGGGHHQLTGTHQRFLVGKGDAPSKADGSQRRFQPHAAHHGGHHGVGFFHLSRHQQTFRSGAYLNIRITQAAAQRICRIVIVKHRKARVEFPRLRFQ